MLTYFYCFLFNLPLALDVKKYCIIHVLIPIPSLKKSLLRSFAFPLCLCLSLSECVLMLLLMLDFA